LSDLHSEKNEFTNYESEQESCYEHIQENFQDDQKQISLSLYLESLNTYQPIYDNYDSKSELDIKEEQILQT
jgi:hypothetical protein